MGIKQLKNSKSKVPMTENVGSLQNERAFVSEPVSIGETRVRHLSNYRWWKDIFDRILALMVLIVLSPFMAFIAIVIRIDSPGGAIYRRVQVGENEQTFTAFKFRTMHINQDDKIYKDAVAKYILEDVPYSIDKNGKKIYKVINDPRVTRFGAILRKFNLDEIPQFFNVLKGEMSLVGPRPDIPYAVEMYQPWHHKRFCVKPGITGLWQISGRKNLSFKNMVHLDINYIKRQSLFLDTKILLLTALTILRGDGS